jgi:hypothetical protein
MTAFFAPTSAAITDLEMKIAQAALRIALARGRVAKGFPVDPQPLFREVCILGRQVRGCVTGDGPDLVGRVCRIEDEMGALEVEVLEARASAHDFRLIA